MEAIDCATRLNAQTAAAVKAAGIVAVGRYLGYKTTSWSKTLTPDELQAIHTAGLSVFLIWESNPTFAGYFNYAKGAADAKLAVEEATCLGAPSGTALYFTVDYNAQTQDVAAIVEYFRGVRDGIGQYIVGAYASYVVLNALKNSADKYWQTYAWSGGKVFPGNIYQYQNSVTVGGIPADRDIIHAAPGAWPELEGGDTVDEGILIFGPDDFVTAKYMAATLGNEVAVFMRKSDGTPPEAIKSAKHLYVIGGAPKGVDHPNQTVLAGLNWFDTVAAVAKKLGY